MQRCFQLARLGAGKVAPNPMVGAVLVHDDRIIGEGYHERFGEAHAEVNCLASVAPTEIHLIASATLYVSLEPCAHYGKTPPCADLIIRHGIPRVVVGCRDSYHEVSGKGIRKLQEAGVDVVVGVLEAAARQLNRRFFIFHEQRRPYIILKWAETADGFISAASGQPLRISGPVTNRLVHRWRSEEAGILVGSRTAVADDPRLTTRLWPGSDPVRLVIDRDDALPPTLHLFDRTVATLVFNTKRQAAGNPEYIQVQPQADLLPQVLTALHERSIQSVLVEGGAAILQSFINAGTWDEARMITATTLFAREGVPAPGLRGATLSSAMQMDNDRIRYFTRNPPIPDRT